MGNTWLTAVFARSPSRGGRRLCLLALADRCDDRTGRCYCGVADVARRAGLSERRARACLSELIDGGELAIVKAGGGVLPDGKGRVNTYQLAARYGSDPTPHDGGTLSPTSGFGRSESRTDRTGTRTPAVANPEVLSAEPCRPRPGDPTEPIVNRQENRPVDGASLTAAAAASLARRDRDPEADAFTRMLAEKSADARRRIGGMSGTGIGGAVRAELDRLTGADQRAGRRRGRLPEPEQAATFQLLRGVPRLDVGDARDLARIAPTAEFAAALRIMPPDVRNPGGWLRSAVREGWAAAHPDDGSPRAGPEPARL